jgi:hypothetical protein
MSRPGAFADLLQAVQGRRDRDEASPVQRARMRAAAVAIQEGRIEVPLACGWCNGHSVVREQNQDTPKDPRGVHLECLSCGKATSMETARRLRRQKIAAIIRKGIDIDLPGGSSS